MTSTFLTFVKVCEEMKVPKREWKFNRQYSYIQFRNGSRIDFLDLALQPSDPLYQRFGSLEYTDGWVEEAGGVAFEAFDILKSRIGRWKNAKYNLPGKIFITANPTKGWLYRTFYWPWKKQALEPQYAFVQALYKDNPFTSTAYGKQLMEIRDQATRERLMLGNWEYDDDPSALIKFDAILDLFTNTPQIREPKFVTADIARFGNSKTVVGVWAGMDLAKVVVAYRQSLQRTSDMIRTILVENQVPYSHCVIDESGLGGGVLDALLGARGFIGNAAPVDVSGIHDRQIERPNYRNLKSQCSFLLAEAINERKMAISAKLSEEDRQTVIQELEQIKSKDADKDRSLQVRTKEEVMEALGRSPDFADMMIMRMVLQPSPPKEAFIRRVEVPYGSSRFG